MIITEQLDSLVD